MAKHITDADKDLLSELGVDTSKEKKKHYTAVEERVIAGFEEIDRFVEKNGCVPQHGENRDIFERLYAVRLDQLRKSEEFRELLETIDTRGILSAVQEDIVVEDKSDEELLASLGIDSTSDDDITQLRHVRSRQEIKAAEEVAQREPCRDFDRFKPIFLSVQKDLDAGVRHTIKFQDDATVNEGDVFILSGQKVLVAKIGEEFIADYGRRDSRLRVIYDNGTESDLLLRSLQRALNKDKESRRISALDAGPLFSDKESDEAVTSGYIYVLRSNSENPFIVENREIIHKIGVTNGDVQTRIANAQKDPTYLLADVEIVATFKLSNINPKKLEALIHKIFYNARIELELEDRFGNKVHPREWFLLPYDVIAQAVDKIIDGSIENYKYEPAQGKLVWKT